MIVITNIFKYLVSFCEDERFHGFPPQGILAYCAGLFSGLGFGDSRSSKCA